MVLIFAFVGVLDWLVGEMEQDLSDGVALAQHYAAPKSEQPQQWIEPILCTVIAHFHSQEAAPPGLYDGILYCETFARK